MFYRKIFSYLSIVFHFVFLRFRVFGNNELLIGSGSLFWQNKFRVSGENNNILLGKNVKLNNTKITINGNNNKIIISEDVHVIESGELLIEGNHCEISIGKKSTLGSGSIFCGESKTSIKVGENCMLSREINLSTSDFHSIIDVQTSLRINKPKNIEIKNDVWIGFSARINKGAVIEKHSVVGAYSIVSGKSYSSNIILAGHPAKILKENITWSREKLPY